MAEPSEELQQAIFDALLGDSSVMDAVQGRIYSGGAPDRSGHYVTFGPSDSVPDDYVCVTGERVTIQIDVWGDDFGDLGPVKAICDKIKRAIHFQRLSLQTHALSSIRVTSTRAMVDQDGGSHGIVTVQAEVEVA